MPDVPISTLQNLGKTSTIAGVTFVMPGNGQVLPTRVLEEVEAALAKMTLKVNYQKGPGWERGKGSLFVVGEGPYLKLPADSAITTQTVDKD